jgi:hypothetical protein
MEVIIKGSIDVGERVLRPGDIMVQGAGQFYGPHTVGPDGALTAEFCAKLRDFPGIAEDGTDMMKAFEAANNVTIA